MIHSQHILPRMSQTGVRASYTLDKEAQGTALLIPDDSFLNQQGIGERKFMRTTIRFQEGDHVHLRDACDPGTGVIQALTEEFVYVRMDYTNERKIFASSYHGKATLEMIIGGKKI